MRTLIALLVLTPLAFAQNPTVTATAAGCGPAEVQFEVKVDKKNHPAGQPETGKALVYFIQDDTHYASSPRPTTRFGVDGTWVGATHANSYFYVSIEPGDHHVCASWQFFAAAGAAHTAAALHLSAAAGRTYYLVARNSYDSKLQWRAEIELLSVDDAQGQLLASEFSFSTSRPK